MKRGILCVMAIFLCAGSAVAQEAEWEAARKKARGYITKGAWKSAEGAFFEAFQAAQKLGLKDPRLGQSSYELGDYYRAMEKVEKARAFLTRAETFWKTTLAAGDKRFEDINLALGVLFQVRGRYAEAEASFRKVLEARAKKSKTSQSYAAALSKLAWLYYDQKDDLKAERFLTRALKVVEDKDPMKALTLRCQLARFYRETGRLIEAGKALERARILSLKASPRVRGRVLMEDLEQAVVRSSPGYKEKAKRLLEALESAYSKTHPLYADALTVAAELALIRGRHSRAEALLNQATKLLEESFGENHGRLGRTLVVMADLRRARGDFTRSQLATNRVLRLLNERARRSDKALFVRGQLVLARASMDRGRFGEARDALAKLRVLGKAVHGSAVHPIPAHIAFTSGRLLAWLAYTKEAKAEFDRSISWFQKSLGKGSPIERIVAMESLALLVDTKAEGVERRAKAMLEAFEKSHGEHLLTARARELLGRAYLAKSLYSKAEPHIRGSSKMRIACSSGDHWLVGRSHALLGLFHERKKKYTKADLFTKSALKSFKSLEVGHPLLVDAYTQLGRVALEQKRWKRGDKALRGALRMGEKSLGKTSPHLIAPLEALLELAKRAKRPDDVKNYRARLERLKEKHKLKNS